MESNESFAQPEQQPKPKRTRTKKPQIAAIMEALTSDMPQVPSYKIRTQDIKPGYHIAAIQWFEDTGLEATLTDERGNQHQVAVPKRKVGVPMTVLAVNLPFIVVKHPNDNDVRGVVDTREGEFMRVSDDFANAIVAPKPAKQMKPFDTSKLFNKEG